MSKVTLTVNGQEISNNWTPEEVETSPRRPADQEASIHAPDLSGVIDVPITVETMNRITKPAVVTCDHCHKRFNLRNQAERTPDGGELQYFDCPHCNHRYEVAFVTRKGLELRSVLGSLRSLRDRGVKSETLEAMWKRDLAAYQAEVHSRLPNRP